MVCTKCGGTRAGAQVTLPGEVKRKKYHISAGIWKISKYVLGGNNKEERIEGTIRKGMWMLINSTVWVQKAFYGTSRGEIIRKRVWEC